jgi:hypothetical protein
LFDDEFSRLTGDPTIRIEHDFRDVEALQTARTERLSRVQLHTALGMGVVDAYAYEGFHDAPEPEEKAESAAPPASFGGDPSVNEPQEDNGEGRAFRAVRGWQDGAAARYHDRANRPHGMESYQKAMEAGILADELIRAGVPAGLATDTANRAACIVHDSVSTIVDTSEADGLVGVRALRCFGEDFARMLAMGLAA